MKAIKIPAERQMQVVETDMPAMGANDVLLRVNYVGFCGSDLNTFRGGNAMVTFPRIPGHEIGATIVETGSDVP